MTVRVTSRSIVHHTLVQLSSLRIFRIFTFVRVVGFTRNDVVGHSVGCFSSVWSKGHFEASGDALLYTSEVGIHAHRSIRIGAGVVASHESAMDGNLMQIDVDAVVLRVSIENIQK